MDNRQWINDMGKWIWMDMNLDNGKWTWIMDNVHNMVLVSQVVRDFQQFYSNFGFSKP